MARVLLGVTGGIAAYKSVELARLAIKAGHSVRVVQTPASLAFVGKATFEGITGAPVLVGEFEPDPARGAFPGDPAPDHAAISHLELVSRADVYAIAPASANTLAKLAGGFADNLLTSAALASQGEWGEGRLAEPPTILAAIERVLADAAGAGYTPRSLDGVRVLVTAGGTREPIDSVRFVGNRSSGRMGLAVAKEAARRGADV